MQIRKLSEHRDYILSLWERASREVLETEVLLEEHQKEEKFLRGAGPYHGGDRHEA